MKRYFVLITLACLLLFGTSGCPNAKSVKFDSLFEDESCLKDCYFFEYWGPGF